LACLVLAGGVVGTLKYGHQARRFVASAAAPRTPATVRVNFNTDPEGASVVRSDGVVLGATPLSTELPYGNTAIEYVLSLEGYLPRTTSIVPNLPSPLFAMLTRKAPGPTSEPAIPATAPPLEPSLVIGEPATLTARLPAAHRARRHPKLQDVAAPRFEADSDDVLEPSYR